MKTSSKKLLSLLLSILMVLSVISLTGLVSSAANGDKGISGDFKYSVISEKEKTCEIKKYTGSDTDLNIPSYCNKYW